MSLGAATLADALEGGCARWCWKWRRWNSRRISCAARRPGRGRGGGALNPAGRAHLARAGALRAAHASAGVGTLSHLLFVLVERRAGVEFTHVPFAGGGPSAQAVLAGTVDMACLAPEEMAGLVQSGDLVPLAVASPERAPGYPAVPTLAELGLPVLVENMKGWVGPAGMSAEMVTYLHDRFRAGMATPVWRRFMDRTGEPDGYADGPGFQRAMDTLLDSITAAIRRG